MNNEGVALSRNLLALLLGLAKDVESDSAHKLGIAHRRLLILVRNVVPASIRRVVLAISGQALRDTDARAVELADDPLLFSRRRALRRREDKVTRPPQRNRLVRQAERGHDLVDVVRQELLRQVLEQRLVRPVVRVDRPGATDGRDAALLRLLVDDAHKLGTDHVVPELTLNDARAETLVHELPAGRLAALQVLALALRGPSAGLVRASGDAPLDEFRDGVLLGVVVVRLHQREHLSIFATPLAVRRAVVTLLQLDDPDALARRPAVLLHNARLEGHRLLEALDERGLVVVGQRVLQADAEIRNLGQRIFRPHELHDIWRRPSLDSLLLELTHRIVELLLAATVVVDLARVAANNERIEFRADFEELVVLLVLVMDGLAAQARHDHAVHKRNCVVAMPVAALVRA